jgi:hypothetical protein
MSICNGVNIRARVRVKHVLYQPHLKVSPSKGRRGGYWERLRAA